MKRKLYKIAVTININNIDCDYNFDIRIGQYEDINERINIFLHNMFGIVTKYLKEVKVFDENLNKIDFLLYR